VEALARLIDDSDDEVAAAAAAALGRIGTPESATQLEKALDYTKTVAGACFECAEKLLSQGNREQALALYGALLRRSICPSLYGRWPRGRNNPPARPSLRRSSECLSFTRSPRRSPWGIMIGLSHCLTRFCLIAIGLLTWGAFTVRADDPWIIYEGGNGPARGSTSS